MNKFRNLQKGIMTSIIGLVIMGILTHKYIATGEFDQTMMIGGMAALGFLFSKDQGASHTKD